MAWLDLEGEILEEFEGLCRFDRAGLRSGFRTVSAGAARKRGDRRAERLRALERVRARRAGARAELFASLEACLGCGGSLSGRPLKGTGAVPRYCSNTCCKLAAARVTNERRKAARRAILAG